MIAYYAHSEGSGHARYASIFYNLLAGKLKIFSSTPSNFSPEIRIMKLAKEDPDGTELPIDSVGFPDYLHYSPVGQHSIQRRSLQLLTGLVNGRCNLFFIDVSVEVAALARASSIPYAYIKLPGLRNDNPHLQALKGSIFNLAYYPEAFEHPSTPKWMKDKTLYLDYFSRFSLDQNNTGNTPTTIRKILVIRGKGEASKLLKSLPDIGKRFEGLEIKALGDFSELETSISGIHFLGYQSKVSAFINEADLVISSAGLNLTSEILYSQKIFCCIPEKRPFNEQEHTASVLYNHRLAYNITDILLLSNEELIQDRETYDHTTSLKKMQLFLSWLETSGFDTKKLVTSFKVIKEKFIKIDKNFATSIS